MFKMTENKQQLREGTNKVDIIGVLKEKDLEVKELTDKKTGVKYNAITGDLVVKVGENGEHKIKIFAKEKTKAGAVSKLFKAYQTVADTYLSIADIAGMPEDSREGLYPTRLSVQGELATNDYYANGKMNSFPEIKGKFISSVKSGDEEDKATFEAEMFIEKKNKELDKDGIETGRLKITGVLVGYGGRLAPIDFIATEQYGVADYLDATFMVGDSALLWGEVINSAVTETITKSGFGQSKEETITTYKNEILVIGGDEFPLDEVKAFPVDLIKIGLTERETYLQQVEEDGKNRAKQPQQKQNGFGKGKPAAPKREISSEDIPF